LIQLLIIGGYMMGIWITEINEAQMAYGDYNYFLVLSLFSL